MKIVINVTAHDIFKGKRCSTRSCPVAHAARRKLRKPVTVGPVNIAAYRDRRCQDDDLLFVSPLPAEAVNFIGGFDERHAGSPFRFEIEVPEGHL